MKYKLNSTEVHQACVNYLSKELGCKNIRVSGNLYSSEDDVYWEAEVTYDEDRH